MKGNSKLYYSEMRFWNTSRVLYSNRLLIFSLFFIGLSSCSPSFQSSIVSLTKNTFEQTDSSNVKIFVSERPKDTYQEICLIRVPVFRKKMYDLDNFKIVAAQQGADAIIDIRLNDNFVSGVAVRWIK